jgi:ATP-binding cassette subfamily F protein uup
VLRLEGVAKRFGERVLFEHLDLELARGERLGVVGPNGAGKTTLLKLCLGEAEPDAGRVVRGETAAFASIDQKRSELDPEKSVVAEVAGANDHVRVGDRTVRIESFLEGFLFPGPHKHARIRDLSGGEKNRVLLAKLLCAGGNVLVLDEPTNDLDLATLRALEEALVAFPGAAIVVSHDRWFLDRVATRVLYLDGRGSARFETGDLSSLLARMASDRARASARPAAPAPSPPAAARLGDARGSRTRGLSPWEQREYDQLFEQIAAAEAALAALDAQIADPALYVERHGAVARVQHERAAADERLNALVARWEALETLRSEPK